ncbi:MAG: cache domain-containing protein [Patescibacteria group bacterium]
MKFKSGHVKYRIVLSICIFGVIITTAAIYISTAIERTNIRLSLSQHLDTIINERTSHIETYLDGIKGYAKDTAADQRIADCLMPDTSTASACTPDELSVYLLKNKFPLINNLVEVYILDAAGIEKASSFLNTKLGNDLSNSREYLDAKQIPYISDIYISSASGEPMINAAAPIFKNAKFAGVLVSRFRTTAIDSIVNNPESLGQTGEAYLVNRDGNRLTPSRFSNQNVLEKINNQNVTNCTTDIKKYGQGANDIAEHTELQTRFINTDGNMIIGDHGYVTSRKWCFLVEMTEKEVTKPIDSLNWINIVVGIITISAITGFAFWISNRVSRTIKELLHIAHEIEGGRHEPTQDAYPNNEVGQMVATLDRIGKKLNDKKDGKNNTETPTPWTP